MQTGMGSKLEGAGSAEELVIARRSGPPRPLEAAALAELERRVAGPLLRPQQEGFEAACRPWNGRIERRPALLASCMSAVDVAEVVRFATAHDLLVSVRGGGHNVGGTSVCEGGLLIDLGPMKQIRVDPERRRAQAEPGVRWRELDAATQAHGLSAPGGQHSEVGIAGFILGGGVGWLARKRGLCIDSLKSVEIVTADGVMRRASASEHPDLFWAVRGGGGNFGIVTSFELELHPVGPIVLAGLLLHPIERAREALLTFRTYAEQASDDVHPMAVLMTGPDGRNYVAFAVCYDGELERGAAVLQPLRSWGPPLVDQVQPMPYLALQGAMDSLAPAGRRYHNRSRFARTLEDGAIDAAIARFSQAPSPGCTVFFHRLGGAMAGVAPSATAFAHRDAGYCLVVEAGWPDREGDAPHTRWVQDLAADITPLTLGAAYVNDLGRASDEGPEEIRAAFGANYRRLAALKAKYDPGNLFSHNQNVAPQG